jgi:hypothetical protein
MKTQPQVELRFEPPIVTKQMNAITIDVKTDAIPRLNVLLSAIPRDHFDTVALDMQKPV